MPELFASEPPRTGPEADQVAFHATRTVRWLLYIVLMFDAAIIALVLVMADPDERWSVTAALAIVFGLFTLPFAIISRRGVRRFRATVCDGERHAARVEDVTTFRVRGTPVHRITLSIDGAGSPIRGTVSMGSVHPGVGPGDAMDVLLEPTARRGLMVVRTPRHGIQSGRWRRAD